MHGRALGRGLLDLERDAPPRAPVAAAPDRAVDAPAQLVLDLVALVVDVAERHGVVAARARSPRRARPPRRPAVAAATAATRAAARAAAARAAARRAAHRLRGLVLLERPPRLLDDLDRRARAMRPSFAIGFCVVPSSPKASPGRGGGDAWPTGRRRARQRQRHSSSGATRPRQPRRSSSSRSSSIFGGDGRARSAQRRSRFRVPLRPGSGAWAGV